MSNNLDLSQVAASQNQKEVTINDAHGELDAALTEVTTYTVSAANARTFTEVEIRRFFFVGINEDSGDPATASVTITMPAIKRGLFVLVNKTAFEVKVEVSGQALASPTIAASAAALLSLDGSNVRAH